jgi:hypothetical protein
MSRTIIFAFGYADVTHITGLVADAPAGRLSTDPVWPSWSAVVTMLAPPLSVQPAPLKLSVVSPGVRVYQLLS